MNSEPADADFGSEGGEGLDDSRPRLVVGLDFYNRPFAIFHQRLAKSGYRQNRPPPIRREFFRLIPPGRYYDLHAQQMVQRYAEAVERELSSMLSKRSLAYWFFLYRRLAPTLETHDRRPVTVGLVRSILEHAIQKYGKPQFCSAIAGSDTIPLAAIFNGMLTGPEFGPERRVLELGPQLVLTDFDERNLEEFYDAERLGYETWRAAATLRILAKGAPLDVTDAEPYFEDARTDEIDALVASFDTRIGSSLASCVGVTFDQAEAKSSGLVLVPRLNVHQISADEWSEPVVQHLSMALPPGFITNYSPGWVDLAEFLKQHRPLSGAFKKHYGFRFETVVAVICAASWINLRQWLIQKEARFFTRIFQRGYYVVSTHENLREAITEHVGYAFHSLAIEPGSITSEELDRAIEFLMLNDEKRSRISVIGHHPSSMFLPVSEKLCFVDLSTIIEILYDLFQGVSLELAHFKGPALEEAVGSRSSFLPRKQCRANNGETKQVDFARPVGDTLVIAECKAVALASSYSLGDIESLTHRTRKVVEAGLAEADNKAHFLSKNPVGKNYNIKQFAYILPVVVSPFVEYIPSLEFRYWIDQKTPRVMTPTELKELLANNQVVAKSMNRLKVTTPR